MTSVAPPSPQVCRAKRGRLSADLDYWSPHGKRSRYVPGLENCASGRFGAVRSRIQTLFPDMDEKVRILCNGPRDHCLRAYTRTSVVLGLFWRVMLFCVYTRHKLVQRTPVTRVASFQVITRVLDTCHGDFDEALEKLTELSLTTNSSPTAEQAGVFIHSPTADMQGLLALSNA